ncbi:hypothetical protein KAJ02_08745 [Candidatus Bipolaricaulota bacterium]|nr:hypothetical protein [Candidatus Bipolaricaulota bacterium]
MSLEDMLLRDELRREPATSGEIQRLLEAIKRHLEDAGNDSIHAETRLEQAYHAILNCALAALRTSGLRPSTGPGHHIIILESMIDTIGIDPSLGDYFQTLRDLRNKDIYTGGTHVSTEQVDEAIEEAAKLAEQLRVWLEAQSEG